MKQNANHPDRAVTISAHALAAIKRRLELLDEWLEKLERSDCSPLERTKRSIEIKCEMSQLLQQVSQAQTSQVTSAGASDQHLGR